MGPETETETERRQEDRFFLLVLALLVLLGTYLRHGSLVWRRGEEDFLLDLFFLAGGALLFRGGSFVSFFVWIRRERRTHQDRIRVGIPKHMRYCLKVLHHH